jgi:hypothetical protein
LEGSSGLHIQDFGLSVFLSGVPPIFGQFALLLLFFLAFVGCLSSLWAEILIRLLQFLVRFCFFFFLFNSVWVTQILHTWVALIGIFQFYDLHEQFWLRLSAELLVWSLGL